MSTDDQANPRYLSILIVYWAVSSPSFTRYLVPGTSRYLLVLRYPGIIVVFCCITVLLVILNLVPHCSTWPPHHTKQAAATTQFRLILAKVGWRLEFRLLNQLLLEIYYRSVTHAIHKFSTGRSYSWIASSCAVITAAHQSVR